MFRVCCSAFFCLLLGHLSYPACSQVQPLLDQITELQCGDYHSFYRDGMFPSQRYSSRGSLAREDNNIFFTVLTVYTLQSLYPELSENQQELLDQLFLKAKSNYPHYRNRNGELSYNFWQVHPKELPFPGRKLWSGMRKFRLADDLDDTSLIYLTLYSHDSTNKKVKQKMEAQVGQKMVKSTLKSYQDFQAYPTWFADKMKQDFDICVMTNVLLFVFEKGLSLSKTDEQTIALISRMIQEDQHKKSPRIISPHYQQTSIILYHVSRLLVTANHTKLNLLKAKLICDLYEQLQRCDNEMERVILLSSLYRLGEIPVNVVNEKKLLSDRQSFYWFKANPFAGSRFWKNGFFGSNWLQARFRSDAYYHALQLELKVLQRRVTDYEYSDK